MGQIRVLVADDHPVVREGVVVRLCQEPDMVVVGEAGDGEEALRLVQDLRPDVLVLDAVMPGIRAGELVRRMRGMQPEMRILVLSAYRDRALVHGLLEAGVHGYLVKEETLERIVAAVREVVAGGMPVSAAVAEVVREIMCGRETGAKRKEVLCPLSPREREVLRLMACGLSNQEIGAALHITERTVKNHVHRIFCKLGVRSRVEAVMYAAKVGWVDWEGEGCGG